MAKPNTNSNYQQQYNTWQHSDRMVIDRPWNDKDGNTFREEVDFFDHVYGMEIMEEQNLSQKMSQLSTSTIKETASPMKDIRDEIDKIPDYLTKQNKSFKQMLYQTVSTTTTGKLDNNINQIEALRKIAILLYKMMVIQTYHPLWIVYLKAGLGQLIMPSEEQASYSITIPIWPKEIQTMLRSKNMDPTNENESCLKLVNDHLHELDSQLEQYQMELNIKVNHIPGYTLTMQQMLETYIEQNLQSLRMEIEHKIELIHYDYHIRALKLEYFRHQPTEYQEQLMKEFCQSTYEQETTEQEYHFLQQQINYYNSPSQSFDSSPIAHCSLIDSIEDPKVRQEFFRQYKEVAEQSRIALFNVYLKSAEEQREEYKKKYEDYEKKMSCNTNENLPMIMIQLIHQRCNKISERIKCIYKFKMSSILSNSKS